MWPRPTLVKYKPGDAVLVLWHTMHSSTRVEGPDPRCMYATPSACCPCYEYARLCGMALKLEAAISTPDQRLCCCRVYFRISSPLRPEGNQRICPDAMRDVSALLACCSPSAGSAALPEPECLIVAECVQIWSEWPGIAEHIREAQQQQAAPEQAAKL